MSNVPMSNVPRPGTSWLTEWTRRAEDLKLTIETRNGLFEASEKQAKGNGLIAQADAQREFWTVRHAHHQKQDNATTAMVLYAMGWRVKIKALSKAQRFDILFHHRDTGATVSSPSALHLAQAIEALMSTESKGATTNGTQT